MTSPSLPEDDLRANEAFRSADASFERGDWAGALSELVPLLRGFLDRLHAGLPPRAVDLASADRLADVAVLLGRPDAAENLLATVQELSWKAGLTFAGDYAALRRAVVAVGTGRLGDCRRLLQCELEQSFGPPSRLPTNLAGLRGWDAALPLPGCGPEDRAVLLTRYYYAAGRWAAAEGFYGHAAALLSRGSEWSRPPHPEAACRAFLPFRLALAGVHAERGEFVEAERELAAVEPFLAPAVRPAAAVAWWEEVARVRLFRGELGTALEGFRHVGEVYWRAGLRRAMDPALLNQAEVLILLNQVSVAEELLDEVMRGQPEPAAAARAVRLALFARERAGGGPLPISVIEMQGVLARSPAPTTPKIIAPSRTADVEPGGFLAWYDARLTDIRYEVGQNAYAVARRRLEDLREAMKDGVESKLISARMRAAAAEVAYHLGEWGGAKTGLEAALRAFDEMGLRPEAWQAVVHLGWCAKRLAAPTAEQNRLAVDADRRLEALAATLPQEQMRVYLLNKWTVEERRLAADLPAVDLARKRAEKSPWLWPLPRFQFWRTVHEFLETVERYHKDRAGKLVGGPGSDNPRAGRLRWLFWLLRHPRDRVTLSFLVLPDSVFVVRAGWLNLAYRKVALNKVGLRPLVSNWHKAANARNEAEAEKAAAALATALELDDLLSDLPTRVTRMTIAADDSLHGFPFAALPVAGKPLIDRFAVTMSLEHLPSPHRPRPRLRSLPALVLGVPQGADKVYKLPGTNLSVQPLELKGVVDEIKYVTGWLVGKCANVIPLVGKDASLQAVIDPLEGVGLFHAACHGVFVPDQPGASGLVLMPDVTYHDTGMTRQTLETLTLGNLRRRQLDKLHHVTLSSCWGADGYALPGRWIISLSEVLLRAGVGSVLANLWQVYDADALSFMTAFYGELAKNRPRDLAVQAAQLALRKKKPSPIYWAGFQLYGSYDRLKL